MCPHRRQTLSRSLLGPTGLLLTAVLVTACGEAVPSGEGVKTATPTAAREAMMVDVTEAVGLDFVHLNGMTGEYYFCEITGPGGALFDADNDGDLDLYLVQGGPLGLHDPSERAGDRLWRNDLAPGPDGSPVLRFTDVTEHSGLEAYGYGLGVATGDFDNDGWTDLYLTNFGSNQLWRNQGPGDDGHVTFRDVTAEAGVDDERWSTSAAFTDYDGDGWLDLYVANYVDFRLTANKVCSGPSSRRDYCGPKTYQGETDRLFRNRGADATGPLFEDVSGAAGILGEAGAGLGVVASDFDGDGRTDFYVANDQDRNVLWTHRGGGADGNVTFVNQALLAGCAANMEGRAESSMGVVAGDVDNDGDDDLFMTHLHTETNTVYLNDGKGIFVDGTMQTGLGPPSLGTTGFGTVFLDLDNDGWLDLAMANGAVTEIEELALAGDPLPLHQPNQLLRNLGPGADGVVRFVEAGDEAGAAFAASEVSRGLAAGDVDNDGDTDLLVLNNHGPARLLLNRAGQEAPWLGLRLVGGDGRRDMIGARVTLERRGAPDLSRRVDTAGSYCSAGDPRVLFGLGGGGELEAVRVRWPDGSSEQWRPPPAAGRYATLIQGTGSPLEGN